MKVLWTILAILISFITLSGFSETYRIFTSIDEDIADNRSFLILMSIVMNLLFISLSVFLWRLALKKKKYKLSDDEVVLDDMV